MIKNKLLFWCFGLLGNAFSVEVPSLVEKCQDAFAKYGVDEESKSDFNDLVNEQDLGTRIFDYTERTLKTPDFSKMHLKGFNFTKARLIKANFKDSILKDTIFNKTVFEDIDFRNTDLKGIEFVNCKFIRCNLEKTDLSTTSLKGCKFKKVKLHGAHLGYGIRFDEKRQIDLVNFYAKFIKNGEIEKAKGLNKLFGVFGLKLVGADLRGLDLRGIDLTRADLSAAQLQEVCLSDTVILPDYEENIELVFLYAEFIKKGKKEKAETLNGVLGSLHLFIEEKDLSNLDLRGINLSNAYLRGVELSMANLTGAKLKKAVLCATYLKYANLTNANLKKAKANEDSTYFDEKNEENEYDNSNINEDNRLHLQGANLTGANLEGADLWSSELKGAWLSEDLQINYDKDIKELFKEWAKNDHHRALYQKLIHAGVLIIRNVSKEELELVNWEGLDLNDSIYIHNLFDFSVNSKNIKFRDIWLYDVGYSTHLVKLYSRLNSDDRIWFHNELLRDFKLCLTGVSLKSLNLRGLNLSGSSLQGADLSGADLSMSDLTGSNLMGANLTGTKVKETDLIGHWDNVRLTENDLTISSELLEQKGVLIQPVSETEYNAHCINLIKDYSEHSNRRTFLNLLFQRFKLDLREADLNGLDLSGMELASADFSGADLTRANLIGAKLSLADLSKTQWLNVKLYDHFVITENYLDVDKIDLIMLLELRGVLIDQEKLEEGKPSLEVNKEGSEIFEPPSKKLKI